MSVSTTWSNECGSHAASCACDIITTRGLPSSAWRETLTLAHSSAATHALCSASIAQAAPNASRSVPIAESCSLVYASRPAPIERAASSNTPAIVTASGDSTRSSKYSKARLSSRSNARHASLSIRRLPRMVAAKSNAARLPMRENGFNAKSAAAATSTQSAEHNAAAHSNARPKSVAANGMLARHAIEMPKEHSAGAIAS